jgi:cysteine-rich repeat protein
MRLGIVRTALSLTGLLVACGGPPPPPLETDHTICGNGIIEENPKVYTDREYCDDGNTASDDGCSSNCSPESGFECGAPGEPCEPICGDGYRKGSEVCDGADVAAGDVGSYCGDDCQGFIGRCGDGIVQADFGERCDIVPETPAATGGTGSGGTSSGGSGGQGSGGVGTGGVGTGGETALGGFGGESPLWRGTPPRPSSAVGDEFTGCTSTCSPELGYVCDASTNSCGQTGVERSELAYNYKTEVCAFMAGLFGGVGNVFSCTANFENYNITVKPISECVINGETAFNQTCTIGEFEDFVLGMTACDIVFTPSPCDGP